MNYEIFILFQVFEVSGVEGDGRIARNVFGRARSLGWPGDLAPPLERLCAACKQIESWLAAHPKNVAILLAWYVFVMDCYI